MVGPTLLASDQMHQMKYRAEGEDFREAMNRIASVLKDNDGHYHLFRDILLDMRFLPAGRVQSAIGSLRDITAMNCYVSGTIQDTFVGEGGWGNDTGSIMRRAWEAAATMRRGGGIGYDFSTLRPRGSLIKKLMSQSNGPRSFMEIFDAVCRATASAGHRRGAQMGVLRVDHPDIEEFIRAKQNSDKLTGFNLSIAITNRFMEAVALGRSFPLHWGGQVHREVDAQELWELIMRSTWDWAEPGVLFIDTINEYNNLWYCEDIAATNPCGEQPLPPFGACLLGSTNLVKYLRPVPPDYPIGRPRWYFDWDQLGTDLPIIVRAMDNVTDRSSYPLPEQRAEALSKRRMGLGVTGLANAGEALGFPYGSPKFLTFERDVLDFIRDRYYFASSRLAQEKGSFPMFDAELYCRGKFFETLDPEVQDAIQKHGIRNSHLTSIAPTGTISFCADNVSSGLEPVFALKQQRTVIEFGGPRVVDVEDYGARVLGVRGKTVESVHVQEHVDVLIAAARRVDSAVSKTCNLPPSTPWEQFKAVYMKAWEGGAKGCTTYNTGGKRGAVLVSKDAEEPTEAIACRYDPETGTRTCE